MDQNPIMACKSYYWNHYAPYNRKLELILNYHYLNNILMFVYCQLQDTCPKIYLYPQADQLPNIKKQCPLQDLMP